MSKCHIVGNHMSRLIVMKRQEGDKPSSTLYSPLNKANYKEKLSDWGCTSQWKCLKQSVYRRMWLCLIFGLMVVELRGDDINIL